ncbi:hypothetical protein MVEN_01294300 [Mycena venus]|uniref:DUF6534 domain-containing protein n=1 Tax=Mycena venus TaxID=2733690 RepID=A0A8H6XX93_9AGAR|nr:hypothetical protein MVEN_01294300 [Mycena venus]
MFEITQSWYYFRNFKQDDWRFKTLVTIALFVDTLGIVGDYICVYLYTITHAGDAEYLENVHWPIPLYGFTTGVLGALVQAFLVFRYWRFTQKTLIALVLSFAIIISFGGVFACDTVLALYTSFADRSRLKIPGALWLGSEIAVDASITSVLLWEFKKARGILTETRSTLDRLTAVTIQSGAAAATFAAAGLILYYLEPESNLPTGVLYPLRRVYVITLLSNLNIRKSAKSFTATGTSSGLETTGRERELPTFTRWTTDDSCAIHVHRTVYTSVQVVSDVPRQDRPPETFKSSFRSAANDSCREEIELADCSSKKQPTLSTV